MADAIGEFFEGLGRRAHEPLLAKVEATLRFDVVDGKRTERWFLIVNKGDLAVSQRNVSADCVVRAPRPLMERLLNGSANPVAAMLRGELTVAGDPAQLVLFQRFLPRPGDSRSRGVPAGYAERKR